MKSLKDINSLSEYIGQYGQELGEQVMAEAKPDFTPGDQWSRLLDHLKRTPFPAQGDAIMAVSKLLDKENTATICAEMGTGKTMMSMSIPYNHAKGKNFRCLVICPGHITRKWKREIEETIPDSKAFIIRKLKDVIALERRKPECREYYILSKDKGKLSYSWKASVLPERRNQGYCCPSCYKPILDENGYPLSIKLLSRKKMVCTHCRQPLWSADGERIRRYAIGEYIKKYFKGYFDYLIADEVHQYKAGNSAQGNMFGALASVIKKKICLTGTLAGGYADELHYLIGRTTPQKLIDDDIPFNSHVTFAQKYGVLERIKKIRHEDDNSCSKGKQSKSMLKRKPGISPLVFSKFLMQNTVFLHLEDISSNLPPYNEYVHEVQMGETLKFAYLALERRLAEEMRRALACGSTKILGIFLINLLAYPDRPFDNPVIVDPTDPKKLIAIPEDLSKDEIYPKEKKLIDLVLKARAENRKVWVFCEYTDKRDVTQRLKSILEEKGVQTEILKSSVNPELRESWIEKKVKTGIDVIISGAKLVETGIDLLDFPEIIFYEQPLSCYTLRQASRRSWRLNQKREVNVSFLFYANTMQQRMVNLLGSKLNACMSLEGKISDEGLAAISSDNMMTQLAKELVNGITIDDANVMWKNAREMTSPPCEKPVLERKEPVKTKPQKIVYVDFYGKTRKRQSVERVAVNVDQLNKLMKERGQKAVQLSLFG